MNILIDLLPVEVKIKSKKYEINSDFRTSILFELMMQDEELSKKQKINNALELYYPIIPNDLEKAIESIMWFYRGGKDIEKSNKKGNGESVKKIYSFEYDDDYIYSAFLDQYRIDLQDIDYLHWWKFKAMFKALKEDNMIVKIMSYRGMDISKIKDKEQKEHYKRLQRMYKIPEHINKDEQEKLNAINQALLNGEEFNHLL